MRRVITIIERRMLASGSADIYAEVEDTDTGEQSTVAFKTAYDCTQADLETLLNPPAESDPEDVAEDAPPLPVDGE
jgi:hypothetical protein